MNERELSKFLVRSNFCAIFEFNLTILNSFWIKQELYYCREPGKNCA